jgi:hypothetical protein
MRLIAMAAWQSGQGDCSAHYPARMSSEPQPPAGAISGRSGEPVRGDDWASQVTAKVEELVALVRDRTVAPVVKIVRYLVVALAAMFIGGLITVLFAAGIVRVLDTEIFHRRVWASYLVVGGIFSLSGLLLSRMRNRRV